MSTASRRPLSLFAALSIIAVLAVCALHTHATYLEYYGDGPPYYGRTTNMDKWQDPMLELVVTNTIGLACLASAAYWTHRRAGSRRTKT
ncbi:MAG TPA: hypothetical protein VJV79_06300 [Polyangiaceae bacterium]|nr:hypothetical protein [Polyangiaceae bacterium]